MCMHGGHQWDWYQPVIKADANGGYGGRHLHRHGNRAVIGLAKIMYAAAIATAYCNLAKKGGGNEHVAHMYHDIWVRVSLQIINLQTELNYLN